MSISNILKNFSTKKETKISLKFLYNYSKYNKSILSGYGFGLPMSNNYCKYLGGN